MSEVEVMANIAPTITAPKKPRGRTGGVKKTKSKPSHPKTSDMVTTAIKNLKERGGSSLQAIKKYIGTNYKVDADKLAPFIRKYLKSAVTSGSLVQTKGKGASGSFKLPGEKPIGKKNPLKKPFKEDKTRVKIEKRAPAVKKSASIIPKKVKAEEKTVKAETPKARIVKKEPIKKPKPSKTKKALADAKLKTVKKTGGRRK